MLDFLFRPSHSLYIITYRVLCIAEDVFKDGVILCKPSLWKVLGNSIFLGIDGKECEYLQFSESEILTALRSVYRNISVSSLAWESVEMIFVYAIC